MTKQPRRLEMIWVQLVGHKERARKFWYRNARKIVIGGTGGTIVFIGAIFVIVPGPPGTPTVALGFTVLATEFLWAKRFLKNSKAYLKDKLPDSQGPRINRIFARVKIVSEHISARLHRHIIKPLTPRRKRS